MWLNYQADKALEQVNLLVVGYALGLLSNDALWLLSNDVWRC